LNTACELVVPLFLEAFSFCAYSRRRRWWRNALARGARCQLRLFRLRQSLGFGERNGPRTRGSYSGVFLGLFLGSSLGSPYLFCPSALP
jgi:hypothetical protein